MIKLLQQYSLADIITFTILLALAIKGIVSFFDWAKERVQKTFNEEHLQLNEKEELERRLQHGSEIMNTLQFNQKITDNILQQLTNKINMLVESDRDDIKSYITREHHYFCYKIGWIDDFSLDCLEKRFKHYSDEGGNSFIEGFMDELRSLPKQPPNMNNN